MLTFLFTQTPLAFLIQSFWRDEAFSYFLANKNIFEIIGLSASEFNPPLYYLIMHYWQKIFGPSEISLRGFSFIFFWATLYVIFLFLQEIFRLNFRKSILYLLLFLINPFLNYYAFEARNYTLLAFFATLSYFALAKKNYRLYIWATVLGLYTHYFMLFVVFSQIAYNYLINKKGLRYQNLKRIIFKTLAAFIPWFLFVLLTKRFFTSSFWIKRIKFKSLFDLLGVMYTGYENGMTFYSQKITLISFFFFLIIAAVFVWKYKARLLDKKLSLFLFLWGVGIPLFVLLISLLKPIFFPRYLIFSAVGFLLLLVYILEQFKPIPRALLFIFLVVVALNFQKLQIKYRKKMNFQRTINEIQALMKKDDLIYVTSELDFFTARYYLAGSKVGSVQQNKVYIYDKSYDEIPDFVGKILISKNDLAPQLPVFPKKAFVLKPDGSYSIQALY